jgi:hypothetical protein
MSGVLETNLKSLPFLHRGKVRDIYAVGEDKLLVVQTDRLSAFDVILDDPIPNKGKILTAMSNFWFRKFGDLMPNHETGIDPLSLVTEEERAQVEGRAIVVKKFTPLGIEAIVRGYLIGSGWKDYQRTGAVCGIALPAGLREAQNCRRCCSRRRRRRRPARTTRTSRSRRPSASSAPISRARCATIRSRCTRRRPNTPPARASSSPTRSSNSASTRTAPCI